MRHAVGTLAPSRRPLDLPEVHVAAATMAEKICAFVGNLTPKPGFEERRHSAEVKVGKVGTAEDGLAMRLLERLQIRGQANRHWGRGSESLEREPVASRSGGRAAVNGRSVSAI